MMLRWRSFLLAVDNIVDSSYYVDFLADPRPLLHLLVKEMRILSWTVAAPKVVELDTERVLLQMREACLLVELENAREGPAECLSGCCCYFLVLVLATCSSYG
jgi:hypothetical protein